MRILHTSDWHLGKKLGRFDRTEEYRAVLDEVEHIADERGVDLVLVSGDVFDRPVPHVESLRLGLEALRRLAARRPVVVVAGNHDSPELFDALAPLLRPLGVHVVGSIRRPEEGGVVEVDTGDGIALVACFPFLREGRVVDFMAEAGHWYGEYAARLGAICRAYNDFLVASTGPRTVPLLAAHFIVNGVRIGRAQGARRGERELHMGQAYTATEQTIPAGPQYVAMGHVHAPQPVPGSPVPAEYAGSLLPLDFGEAGERKRVVLIEARPGMLATRETVPITQGRPLLRATGTWDELARRADLKDAYADLTVVTTGPDPGLADRAREEFPYLVYAKPEYPRAETPQRPPRAGRSWEELYADYNLSERGTPPTGDLAAAFRDVLQEAEEDAHASP